MSSHTSAKTGRAPCRTAALAVAQKVSGAVITSSPGPTPQAKSAASRAVVPEERATAKRAPTRSAKASSKASTRGPVVSQPERSTSTTAATSSSRISGRA